MDFYLQKGVGRCPIKWGMTGVWNREITFLRKYFVNITALLPNVILFFTLFKKLHFPGYGGFVRNGVWNMEPTESCFE